MSERVERHEWSTQDDSGDEVPCGVWVEFGAPVLFDGYADERSMGYEILNLATQLRERDERIAELECSLAEQVEATRRIYPVAKDRLARLEAAERKLAEAQEAILEVKPMLRHDNGCHPSEGRHTPDCLKRKAWLNLPAVREAMGRSEG